MAKFGLEARIMSGGSITGYVLVGENGRSHNTEASKVIQLAEEGKVFNWEVVVDSDGEKHLYSSTSSISELPMSGKELEGSLEVIRCKAGDSNETIVECKDSNGTVKEYSISKVWSLAEMGVFKDLKCATLEGKRALVSEKGKLAENF